MADYQFEEEDYDAALSGRTLKRMLTLTLSHWTWLAGFLVLVTIVAIQDSIFSFLKKEIIDLGITPADIPALTRVMVVFVLVSVTQAAGVFGFIFLASLLGVRVQYDLRQ